jgi:UDP-3-O-[3-hydroxymyristoyl] glucosamine N-acyltransferase
MYIDIPNNATSEISSFYTDANSSLLSIKDCDGFSNMVCFVGAGIQVYDVSNNTSLLVYNTNQQYNSIYVYNENYAIAVGTNIISFTTNGVTHWSDVPVSHINKGIFNIKNVYIYDTLQALAIGDNGLFLYTLNGSLTWQKVPDSILNTSGIGNRLTDISNQLECIFMPDANSFVVSKTLSEFSDVYYNSIDPSNVGGKSNILYGHYPNLFNRSNHKVLDVSGNMVITGDIGVDVGNVNVDGNIQGNSQLHIMGDSMLDSRLFVGGNTSLNGNVSIAFNTVQSGDVTMNSRLFVQSDVSLNKRVYVNGDANMNASLFVGKKTIHQGDVSMNSRLFVSSDVLMNGKLYVNADASFNSRLFIGSDIFIGNDLFITGNTILKSGLSIYSDTALNGNVYIGSRTIQQGDVSMNSKLFVGSDASFNQNVYISAKTINQGDVIMNSRLYVNGDSSFNGNVYIGSNTIQQGDVSMNSRLFVQSDASFNAKVFVHSDMNVNSGLIVGRDTSFNGNVYVGSNTIQNGNVTMNSNIMVKQNATVLGNVNCASDINIIGNIYTDSTVYSNNYDSKINENTIFIGSKNTNRTINIGYGGNLSNSNIINIGNPNDTIVIHGTTTSATQAVTAQKYFVANKDNPINGSSYGGGLLIYDNNNDYAGYTILSQDMNGFLFKATQSNNVVRMDIKSMVLPNISVNGPPNASILWIVPSTDLQSNYTVTTNDSLYLDSTGNFHSTNKSIFHTDISGMGNFSILGNTNLNNTMIQSNNDGPALQMNGIMVSNSPIFQF